METVLSRRTFAGQPSFAAESASLWLKWLTMDGPDGLRSSCKESRKGRPTSGGSESHVAIPKTPAETLTEAISFVGKSFPKREIFGAFATLLIGNAFESSLPEGDARDGSFPYEA